MIARIYLSGRIHKANRRLMTTFKILTLSSVLLSRLYFQADSTCPEFQQLTHGPSITAHMPCSARPYRTISFVFRRIPSLVHHTTSCHRTSTPPSVRRRPFSEWVSHLAGCTRGCPCTDIPGQLDASGHIKRQQSPFQSSC